MAEETLLPPSGDTSNTPPPPPPPQGETPPQGAETPPGWSWNDEVPGAGEAPEWFRGDKYGSVAAQAQAYNELASKFGAFTGAPEQYEIPPVESFADSIELPEGVAFDLDPEDPLLQAFMPAAAEMGINQDGFNKLVGLYIQNQANDYAATMQTADSEKQQLGDRADERLEGISRWGQANLDAEMYGKLTEVLTSAASVEVVEALIGKTRNAPIPSTNDTPGVPGVTKQDYDIEMGKTNEKGELLYIVDPAHRQKVARMGERLFGKEPNRQIMS